MPSPFNPTVARTLLASDKVRYVGEPRRRRRRRDARPGRRRRRDGLRRHRLPPGARRHRGGRSTADDAALRGHRLERRVRHDRARHAREHRRRRRTSPTARSSSPAASSTSASRPCPLEVRGSAAAWIDGRLHQWVSTQHAQGAKGAVVGANGVDAADVRDHHARRRWRVRRQDRLVPRGAAARPDRQARSAARCAGARPAASR